MRVTSGLVDYHVHPHLRDTLQKVKDRFGFMDEDIIKDFWRSLEEPESVKGPYEIFDGVLDAYMSNKTTEIYREFNKRADYADFLLRLIESEHYPRNKEQVPEFFDRMWEIIADLIRRDRGMRGSNQQQPDEFEEVIEAGRRVLQLLSDPLMQDMFDPGQNQSQQDGDEEQKDEEPQSMAGTGSHLQEVLNKIQQWDPYIVQALLISQDLDFSMTFSKMGQWNPSPFPDDSVDVHKIKDSRDLVKLLPKELALPSSVFYLKYAKKELLCREFMIRQDKRQLVYVLLDVSGSMRGNAAVVAMSIVLALLRRVTSQGDHYFMREFEQEPHELKTAQTEEEAKVLTHNLLHQTFPGGGTSIQNALMKAFGDIKKAKAEDEMNKVNLELRNCQVLLLTDGEDRVNVEKVNEAKGDIKLHTVLIGYQKAPDYLKSISDTVHGIRHSNDRKKMIEIINTLDKRKQQLLRKEVKV